MQRAVELQVGGQRYRVVSSASPEDLERLARVVDDKIAELVPPGRTITPQALLLAAIALAHELEEAQVRLASLQRETGLSLSRILGRVDEALASIDAPASPHAPASPAAVAVAATAARSTEGPRSLEANPGLHDPLDR